MLLTTKVSERRRKTENGTSKIKHKLPSFNDRMDFNLNVFSWAEPSVWWVYWMLETFSNFVDFFTKFTYTCELWLLVFQNIHTFSIWFRCLQFTRNSDGTINSNIVYKQTMCAMLVYFFCKVFHFSLAQEKFFCPSFWSWDVDYKVQMLHEKFTCTHTKMGCK